VQVQNLFCTKCYCSLGYDWHFISFHNYTEFTKHIKFCYGITWSWDQPFDLTSTIEEIYQPTPTKLYEFRIMVWTYVDIYNVMIDYVSHQLKLFFFHKEWGHNNLRSKSCKPDCHQVVVYLIYVCLTLKCILGEESVRPSWVLLRIRVWLWCESDPVGVTLLLVGNGSGAGANFSSNFVCLGAVFMI